MKKLLLIGGLALISASASAAEPAKPVDPEDKVKCKRIGETGSLARVQKVCRTEREWRMLQKKGRDEASDLTSPTGGMRSSG